MLFFSAAWMPQRARETRNKKVERSGGPLIGYQFRATKPLQTFAKVSILLKKIPETFAKFAKGFKHVPDTFAKVCKGFPKPLQRSFAKASLLFPKPWRRFTKFCFFIF